MGRSCRRFPAEGARTPSPGLGTQRRYRAGRRNACCLVLAQVAPCAPVQCRYGCRRCLQRCSGSWPFEPHQTQHRETFPFCLFPNGAQTMPALLLLLLLPPAPRGAKLFMCKANILGRTQAPSPAQFRGGSPPPPPSSSHHGVTFSRLSVPRWVAEPGWHRRRRRARRERDRWERGRLALPVPG